MKTIGWMALSLVMPIGAPAFAQDSDLVGTWTASATVLLKSDGEVKKVTNSFTIVFQDVEGSSIQGIRTWKNESGDPGYVGDEATTEASEPFIGTVTSDGNTIRLVEVNDSGLLFGERLGADRIEFSYLEFAPHPVAWTAIFERAD